MPAIVGRHYWVPLMVAIVHMHYCEPFFPAIVVSHWWELVFAAIVGCHCWDHCDDGANVKLEKVCIGMYLFFFIF